MTTKVGTRASDTLRGTSASDRIMGDVGTVLNDRQAGNDFLYGYGAADYLFGDALEQFGVARNRRI